MDRSWIKNGNRVSLEYRNGVDEFIHLAILNSENRRSIRCPCKTCCNIDFQSPEVAKVHLFKVGFLETYVVWNRHGESGNNPSSRKSCSTFHDETNIEDMLDNVFEDFGSNPESFRDVVEDSEKPLYPGSNYSKLSGVMLLFNIKGKYGWSDQGFTALLEALSMILPPHNSIPKSMYEAKKIMKVLGLDYQKIHACRNDCILYHKNYSDLEKCPTCGESRFKVKKNGAITLSHKIPEKVLWYFPPIPRFKRMFQSPKTAEDLTWHANHRVKDGKLRHPSDGAAWNHIDNLWPDFGDEPRNLRLALSSDGVNPHSSLSSSYSCWPVQLAIYNLPPWLTMKRKFMMLSLLISGPKQPGNDLDVYLEPLIDDLKILWNEGVDVFDGFRKESFKMRAILMWTISDFPAYGNLSGSTVKGYFACPICGSNTSAVWLPCSRKCSYMGHRHFLPDDHKFRDMKKVFNNKVERRGPPETTSGQDILKVVERVAYKPGKGGGKQRKRKRAKKNANQNMLFKRKSIFFDLEYWQHLLIRHLLDVMHIEKNVCENMYGTLLDQPTKTKDGPKARNDLLHLKIRKKLVPDGSSIPPAPYTLSKEDKRKFCQTILETKVPDGYSSNLKSIVSDDDNRLQGLKSHDCHTLMQQILPLAIRNLSVSDNVTNAITGVCLFFNAICEKVLDLDSLDKLEADYRVTLCWLEQYFLPSFFDIMLHLTVHLIAQIRLCGPPYLCWMYPFERSMKVLKGYVRNHYHPEGCIAESYAAEEALDFCAEYLSNHKAIGLPNNDDDDDDGVSIQRPVGRGDIKVADLSLLEQAHRTVLFNTPQVQPYIQEHMLHLQSKFVGCCETEHYRTFTEWFEDKVRGEVAKGVIVDETVRCLAKKPNTSVTLYAGYIVNGYNFATKDKDSIRVTQNSGVTLVADTIEVSSSKDSSFYGVLDEIWVLNYLMTKRVVFKCDWVDSRHIKKDKLGFTVVDLNKIGHRNDCFILASHAKQVFYVKDQLDPKKSIVCSVGRRASNNLDFGSAEIVIHEPLTFKYPLPVIDLDNLDDDQIYTRVDVDAIPTLN